MALAAHARFLGMFLKDVPRDSGRRAQRQRYSLLKYAHKGEIMALCEIAQDILAKRLAVPPHLKPYLRGKVTALRQLSSKSASVLERRKLLTRPLAEALCEAARPLIEASEASRRVRHGSRGDVRAADGEARPQPDTVSGPSASFKSVANN